VKRGLAGIFKSLGASKNFASTDVLATDQWKEEVADFQTNLLEDIDATRIAATKELIIVPDGQFWYLPWESFFIDLEAKETTFGDAMSIRYCPTLSLAFAKPLAVDRSGQTGLVAGVMHPKTDNAVTTSFVDQFVKDVPDAIAVPDKVIFPSSHSVFQLDQLVTFQMEKPRAKPYDIKPLAVDTARFGTTLFDWMKLPVWGPDTIVLPGLNSIGGGSSKADGSDLFLTTTALLASGSRAALVPRWNSGGQMQVELAGRFAKHSRSMSLNEALKTSIGEVKQLKVDYGKEPRIDARVASNDPPGETKPDAQESPDAVAVPLPGDTAEVGSSTKEAEEPAPEKPPAKAEVVSEDDDDEEEGAVWSIGGKKK